MSVALLVITGALTAASLILLARAHGRHVFLLAVDKEVMRFHAEIAEFHTKLDEYLASPRLERSGDVWSVFNRAAGRLGRIEKPPVDIFFGYDMASEDFRTALPALSANVDEMRSVAEFLIARRVGGEIILPFDTRFHELYVDLLKRIRVMEEAVDQRIASARNGSRRLIAGLVIFWLCFFVFSSAILLRVERLRRRAERELLCAYEEMERRVEERTADFSRLNADLKDAIRARIGVQDTLVSSERKYRELYQEFHALLDAINDPLVLLSPDLKVLWTNRAASDGIAAERSDIVGMTCHELIHNTDAPCDACPAVKAFSSGREESSRISTSDDRLLDLRVFPVRGEQDRVLNVILTVSDITERKALEAEALRRGHLASLGELAAGVAHEINNPVNGIINYSQILSNISEPGSEQRDLAARVIKEGERIAVIVRSLLSFARDRKEDKNVVSVHHVLEDALTLVKAQMRKDAVILQEDRGGDVPDVVAHPQQIQQVFLNLINNARYALNERYPGPDPAKVLRISTRTVRLNGRGFVRTVFYDQGAGIPPQALARVMDPFFTTKPRGEGTGLGLSISHGIIRDHDGTLRIESGEGEFTRVTVDLPEAWSV